MRTLVTDENKIRECQKKLEDVLKKQLNPMGSRRGKSGILSQYSNGSIWYETLDDANNTTRFLNFFWLVDNSRKSGSAVEINIHKTNSSKLQGAFVKNENGDIELIRRGLFNGCGDEIIKNVSETSVEKINGKEAIIIGDVDDSNFIDKLSGLIQKVNLYKGSKNFMWNDENRDELLGEDDE